MKRTKLALFLCALVSVQALGGNGEGRGGGSFFVPNSKYKSKTGRTHPALLDLVTHPSYRFDDDLPETLPLPDFSKDMFFRATGFQRLPIGKDPAFAEAKKRIE